MPPCLDPYACPWCGSRADKMVCRCVMGGADHSSPRRQRATVGQEVNRKTRGCLGNAHRVLFSMLGPCRQFYEMYRCHQWSLGCFRAVGTARLWPWLACVFDLLWFAFVHLFVEHLIYVGILPCLASREAVSSELLQGDLLPFRPKLRRQGHVRIGPLLSHRLEIVTVLRFPNQSGDVMCSRQKQGPLGKGAVSGRFDDCP